MDIGDASEIPATRKKLPSLQELGAFDLEQAPVTKPPLRPATSAPPTQTRPSTAPVDKPATGPIAKPATGSPPATAERPRASNEQIRQALAKADPATRKKLLHLIAGGRTVEQLGGNKAGTASRPQHLVMNLNPAGQSDASPPAAPEPARPTATTRAKPDTSTSAAQRRDGPPIRPSSNDRPLMQIDGNTELFDAAPAPLSAEQQKTTWQNQLASSQPRHPPRGQTPAHKVLFPAYDPKHHGDDVRRPTRRDEGPVEGHFPAPRQPFQASYRHADGRPMNEEETKVEEVLQEQRCEQTLEVLARDGINGLLLSPRDLDVAVANGVLEAETADLLWKTWSALRPVIHVIDDEPARDAAAEPDGKDNSCDDASAVESGAAAINESASSAESPDIASGSAPATGDLSNDCTAGQTTETIAPPVPEATIQVEPALPAPSTIEAARAPSIDPPVASATSAITPEPILITSPEPHPGASRIAVGRELPVFQAQSEPPKTESTAPKGRAVVWLRRMVRFFVIGCVVSSSVQIALWAWRHWGHWLLA